MEKTLPMQAPDFSAAPPAVGAQVPPASPAQSIAAPAEAPVEGPAAVLPARKPNLIPAMLGGLFVVLLATGAGVYWKIHQGKTVPAAPAPAPPVVVQTQPAAPPPVAAPVEIPAPAPAPTAQTAPRVNPAPEVAKKAAPVHKTKQAEVKHPAAPPPAPTPAQPAPVVVTPPLPKPAPPAPNPEAAARAEAAKLANVPRIVQVVCNFGLKEATFTFTSKGQILLQETFKGKKKKEGFMGIKGSYQGTFSHTITVPAGSSDVFVHVVSRDGATDLSKSKDLPPPGGFVPTLTVGVDNEHLSLDWQGPSTSK